MQNATIRRRVFVLGLIAALLAVTLPSSSILAFQRQAGSSRRLDSNLNIGDRGYNRRVESRRGSLERPKYTVTARGDMRYNYNNAFGRSRQYRPHDSMTHYDNHMRRPNQGQTGQRRFKY
jgi:hypothetical protein